MEVLAAIGMDIISVEFALVKYTLWRKSPGFYAALQGREIGHALLKKAEAHSHNSTLVGTLIQSHCCFLCSHHPQESGAVSGQCNH